jgi:hypothetical protein
MVDQLKKLPTNWIFIAVHFHGKGNGIDFGIGLLAFEKCSNYIRHNKITKRFHPRSFEIEKKKSRQNIIKSQANELYFDDFRLQWKNNLNKINMFFFKKIHSISNLKICREELNLAH